MKLNFPSIALAVNQSIHPHKMSNKAAYIVEAKANPLEVRDAPLPSAGKGEVVVKNQAAAVNPVDCTSTPSPLSGSQNADLTQGRSRIMVCTVTAVSGIAIDNSRRFSQDIPHGTGH